MSCARIAELPLAHYHSQVGAIWRSRNDEPEQEIFDSLPDWMDQWPDRTENQLDILRLLTKAFKTMGPQEVQILRLRFWKEMTYIEIGSMFELTGERIRQIESRALRKMKHPSRFNHLRQYGDLFTGKWRKNNLG